MLIINDTNTRKLLLNTIRKENKVTNGDRHRPRLREDYMSQESIRELSSKCERLWVRAKEQYVLFCTCCADPKFSKHTLGHSEKNET